MDGAEVATHLTDPNVPDTDGDGLTDGAEVATYHTNPLAADTDGDGLDDGAEVTTHHSNPLAFDSDGDGYGDGWEIDNLASNPTDPAAPNPVSGRHAIGIKFAAAWGARGNYLLEPAMAAGAPGYVQRNWNRSTATVAVGTEADIAVPAAGLPVDESGTATAVTLAFTSNNLWSANNESQTPYGRLYAGYLDSSSANPNATVTVSGIPYARYNVVVYLGSAANGAGIASVSLNGVNYRYTLASVVTNGTAPTYVRSTDSSANFTNRYNPAANVVVFRGVTGTSSTITHTRINSNAGIFAVQIVEDLDTDNDGMGDFYESANGLNGATDDAAGDLDTDGLTNLEEYNLGTDPRVPDADGDGLSDGAERKVQSSNPFLADTDGDGLADGDEVNTHHSSPINTDSDNDGYRDGYEVLSITSYPADAASPGGVNPPAIGIAFASQFGELNGYAFSPATFAGVAAVRQKNWNRTTPLPTGILTATNANIGQPTAGLLVNSAGAATTMTVTATAAGVWSDANELNTPYGRLFNGFAYNDATTPNISVNLGSIPYSSYDVYVYVGADFNGRTGVVNSGLTAYSFTTGSNTTGGHSDYVETTAATGNPVANYCVFRNQSGAAFTFNVTRGNNNVGLFGIQVVNTGTTTAYGSWAAANGLDPLTDGAPGADKDHDGATNLTEHAFGTAPAAGSSRPAQIVSTAGAEVTLTYLRAKAATDVTYTAEWSKNLVDWSTVGLADTPTGVEQSDTIEHRAAVAKGTDLKEFVRVRVSLATDP